MSENSSKLYASETAFEAYEAFVQQCDAPGQWHSGTTYKSSGISFLVVYALGLPLQLAILPANARLAKQYSAFLLLLHINILNSVWLLQYIWLGIELIIGQRLIVPLNLEAYLFRVVNFCIDFMYIVLALNRSMAVLDSQGRVFNKLFSQRNNRIYIAVIWLLGICYSIYMNWLPVRRPFHCLMQLGYFEPTVNIPKSLLNQLPDSWFYEFLQHFYMTVIYIPVILYVAAFAKLFFNFAKRKIEAHSPSITPIKSAWPSSAPNASAAQPAHKNSVFSLFSLEGNSANNANQNIFQNQFANLALERSRLFLLCFFSQLPYLLANAQYFATRLFTIDAGTVQVMAICAQLFGTIFHVQQPVLMLLLSRDMKRGVKEDFGIIVGMIRKCFN